MPDPIFFESVANPTLSIPPIAHAEHHWVEDSRTLFYEYNGRPIIEMVIPQDAGEFGFRHSSDGDIQSWPYLQQLYFMLDKPSNVVVTFHMSQDAVTMRPNRAGREQAISGQVGRPLVYGVNGLYDINQDLLVDWHGRNWRWIDESLTPNDDGDLIARVEVEFGPKPWFLNLRPHYYRTHLGYQYHEPWRFRPYPNPVTGWCSWEAYRRDVSEENVAEAAEFFSRTLKPYGMTYPDRRRLRADANPRGSDPVHRGVVAEHQRPFSGWARGNNRENPGYGHDSGHLDVLHSQQRRLRYRAAGVHHSR
jgi:hypothetical protein